MLNALKIFPPLLILLTVILIILLTIVAILLRYSLYHHLIDSANKVSRLLFRESRGKQPELITKLEARFKAASQKLEQVNTIALIDGLYSREKLKFLGINLRCEQWDYFCQTLPNLLLAFGLLGTFIGISSNLYNLSQTISEGAADVDNLIAQLQTPLQNMGIAFFTSLVAIACSSILIMVNLRCNTNFAKSLLISSLEDYLDNIFKIDIDGYGRLDKAVDRMVKQQEEFLIRFHDKVGQVLETTIGNAANQMVAANQGFQNNVDSMVSRFNDISSSIAASTNSFHGSVFDLKEQIQTVNEIVPKFETATKKIEFGSQLYLQGAEKIEASKFSDNLENLTRDLATTQKSFSQSTKFLGDRVKQFAQSQQQVTELAQQVYTQLQTASSKLQDSPVGFIEAAETFQKSDFADKLTTATNELTTIPQQFNESTAILHQSTNTLSNAIEKIDTVSQETNNLIQQLTDLNQHSIKLLETSDRNIQEEVTSFSNINAELNRIVNTLDKHKEQINLGLTDFAGRILKSFEKQTDNNAIQLQKPTSEINNSHDSLQQNQIETTKFLTILQDCINSLNTTNFTLTNIVDLSKRQGEQISQSFNNLANNSYRLLTSFERRSQNNIQEIQNLIVEFKQFMNKISD